MLHLAQLKSLFPFRWLAGAFKAGRPAPVIPGNTTGVGDSNPAQPDQGAQGCASDPAGWAAVMAAYDEQNRLAVASGADVSG